MLVIVLVLLILGISVVVVIVLLVILMRIRWVCQVDFGIFIDRWDYCWVMVVNVLVCQDVFVPP